jgi:hypothetical protein
VTGDEVYGLDARLRAAIEARRADYVLKIPCSFRVTLPTGQKMRADHAARLVPARAWQTASAGRGSKGDRDYSWAWLATASPRHHLLVRRSLTDPSDLAYCYCHLPPGRACMLTALIRVAGRRWRVEEDFALGKSWFGLADSQVRHYTPICRHLALAMAALAVCAVAAALARPRTSTLTRPPTAPMSCPTRPRPDPADRRRDQAHLQPDHPCPAARPPPPVLVLVAAPAPGPRPLVPPASLAAQARIIARKIRITGERTGMLVTWNRQEPGKAATSSRCTPRPNGSRYCARPAWTLWPTTAPRPPTLPARSLKLPGASKTTPASAIPSAPPANPRSASTRCNSCDGPQKDAPGSPTPPSESRSGTLTTLHAGEVNRLIAPVHRRPRQDAGDHPHSSDNEVRLPY